MDFDLTQEQRDLQRLCRQFAEQEIRPYVEEHRVTEWEGTQDDRFPYAVWDVAHENGLHLMTVPEEYGGEGFDPDVRTQAIMLEELATGDHSIANGISTNWKLATLLRQFPEPLQDEWLPKMVDDPYFAMAHALTEPRGASDRWLPYNEPDGNMNTTAVKDGDEWVINGTKQFVTNGWEADIIFTYANSDPEQGILDGTSGPFLVPRETPGVEVSRVNETVGHRFASNAEMHFDDVRVPDDHLLIEDTALRDVGTVFSGGRVKVAARILGTGRAAFEAAFEYAHERVQGGTEIINHQAIGHDFAEMAIELQSARALMWTAARAIEHGAYTPDLGPKVKVQTAEVAFDVAKRSLEKFGGLGIMMDYPAQKYLRDTAQYFHAGCGQEVLKEEIVGALRDRYAPA
jgi:alkylation response protein AidB-like acyl-CoA dehydrogenase